MNNVKTVFSIKDLENLSGIKAHTIRIWEKRYKVLAPSRTDTNIRLYDIPALKKLLNISLLNEYGYKISMIAKLSPDAFSELVGEIINEKSASSHAISDFKMAMMNFDQELFLQTYEGLLSERSFRYVFREVFLPLLAEIGLLWQKGTITPAHEHFISYLIKQKILVNTEKINPVSPRAEKVFALYLPMGEIHEIGLMYLNYELLSHGYKTVYLGESVPISCLADLKRHFDRITFVCYATVSPVPDELNHYIDEILEKVVDNNHTFWMMGRMGEFVEAAQKENFSVIRSMGDLLERIK